jgi:predicted nuclease of predicted toxin-antitoxin system
VKLFADLYLDEDVSVLVAALLRARGFDVVTARDQGMLGRSDAEQLARAASLGRCIFTHNRFDYEELQRWYVGSHQKHCGIIVGSRRDVYELARRAAILLNTLSADEIENQLLYI